MDLFRRAVAPIQREYPLGVIELSNQDLAAKVAFHGLSGHDLGVVAAWRETLLAATDQVLDSLFELLEQTEPAWRALTSNSTAEQQRELLRDYLVALFQGRVDDAYVESRRLAGFGNDRINLDSHYYIGMYNVFRARYLAAVQAAGASSGEVLDFVAAFDRLLQVDLALCINAFMKVRGGALSKPRPTASSATSARCWDGWPIRT